METKKCEICGKLFKAKNKNTKCCSKACGYYLQRRNRTIRQEQAQQEICPVCGETFARRAPGQKYCGESCKKKAHYAEKKRKRLGEVVAQKPETETKESKICPYCGKKFVPRRGQKFCSNYCGNHGRQKNAVPIGRRGSVFRDIRITGEIPVFPELRPPIGAVYRAEVVQRGKDTNFYIIRKIGKYGLIVRGEECMEVAADGV